MTKTMAYNILEIDSELEWLMSFNDLYLKEIEELKIKKINLYEQSTDTVTA